mmetsp:Transcript_22787/g.55493  ORF Transcript_22787/g.55493 Transcript_22787/m.55493 type:complete len:711 (-) Transcript_22787:163-2295(-)|eukprot:CAMPEP_0114119348 /NCGR_PEP_ID=MMETSP0043_2-20121206/6070_1 /TAXON_ID=464988 /ORGANISM="Hemiselmis andersenii, Strain CCMP644" /LENGTH=710 /DNA_ID=CAMNT_0001211903 /DNA_START=73 /DNA_END=2205 /DNA_ORIENTATION=-
MRSHPATILLLVLSLLQNQGVQPQQSCGKSLGLQKSLQRAEGLALDDAAECLRSTMAAFPNSHEVHGQLFQLLRSAGRSREAAEELTRALPPAPKDNTANLMAIIAQAWEAAGDEVKAVAAYKETTALAPKSEVAWYNLGYYHMTHGDYDSAVPAFLKSVELNPKFGKGHEAAGAVYFGQGEEEKALPYLKEAKELMPESVNTLLNYANALGKLERAVEAIAAYQAVLDVDPEHADAANKLAFFSVQACDWRDYNANFKRVSQILSDDLASNRTTRLIPFNALILPTSPSDQLLIARSHAAKHDGVKHFKHMRGRGKGDAVLKVGYLSADFRDHPMGRDLSNIIMMHRRNFAVPYAYAQNPPHEKHDGVYRQRIVENTQEFRNVNGMSDYEAASLIQQDGVEVLVDLMGYTHGARDGVLAHRPAPVQVAFKGYMSTTGSSYVTHLISDSPSVPPESVPYYSEKQVYINPVFVASTHPILHEEGRMIKAEPPTKKERLDSGLNTTRFVYACFNSLYKVSPSIFDSWMKILKAVPESVLWLLEEPIEAKPNLCRHAEKHGVNCTRLVFTKKVELYRHIIVKSRADLFLDTPLYNAHTTAADSLWATVPILTLPREKMASRVAASLTLSLGMPELVARTMEEYTRLAILLGKSHWPGCKNCPSSKLRKKLHKRRMKEKYNHMFDIDSWQVKYEAGLRMLREVGRTGGHVVVAA